MANDLTAKVVNLGQPFNKPVYARNVWDMQLFNGKIYLAHGNEVNTPPAPNAGPIPVIYYDPSTNKFVTQYTAPEEQINVFKIINGNLYFPGDDATESWDFGNYYILDNNVWTKMRTIPKASHVFDITSYKGQLYAATGTEGFGEVVTSQDNGLTWKSLMPQSGNLFYTYSGMAHTLFEFKAKLYAVSSLTYIDCKYNDMLMMDGATAKTITVYGSKMLPGASNLYFYRILRPTVINDTLLYLGVKEVNYIQWSPDSMYIATDINQSTRVVFPQTTALPVDIVTRGSTVYVSAYIKNTADNYTNIVYSSSDLKNWRELFRFNYNTFARSFEELNGDFYFGLGCHVGALPESTGSILKILKADIS